MASWPEFLDKYLQTLGVTLAFAIGGAGLLVWSSHEIYSASKALMVVTAGLLLAAGSTAFFHGYLGWNIFIAPFVGATCGLIALPVLLGVAKIGQRIGSRAPDIGDKLIDRYTGKETK